MPATEPHAQSDQHRKHHNARQQRQQPVPVAEAPSGVSGPPEMVDLVYTRDGAALEAAAVPVAPQG